VKGETLNRRKFITGATLGFLATPPAAQAQPAGKVTRIAVLGATRPEDLPQWEGLRQGLRERGYVEGQNISIDYRWAQGRFEPGGAPRLRHTRGSRRALLSAEDVAK
jgi:putative ABC transport system substrate-binding protein